MIYVTNLEKERKEAPMRYVTNLEEEREKDGRFHPAQRTEEYVFLSLLSLPFLFLPVVRKKQK